jgi:CheY-like chemotaxis protein
MLSRMGHTVDAVEDGAQAVEAARQKVYDIILMDMQMPVMDGPEATRHIRQGGPNAQTPVIALTADVIADHRSTYFAAGVNAIVGKPINWTELSEEMDRQLLLVGEAKTPPPIPEPVAETVAGGLHDALKNTQVLDESAVAMLADALGEDVLAPMLHTFETNLGKYRDDLATHVHARDLKQAQRTGHALKGLCAQFGAMRASGYGKFIEMEAADIEDVATLLPALAETIAATEAALAARRARLAGSAA